MIEDRDSTRSLGPNWKALFHGAVRQSLAAINCVARIGIQQTNVWERPFSYLSDDNQGNVGLVSFATDGAVVVMSARAPEREFNVDGAVVEAPPRWQSELVRLSKLPLFQEGCGVSGLLWTVRDHLEAPQGRDDVKAAALDMFELELLDDATWSRAGARFFGMSPEMARYVVALASRAAIVPPILTLSALDVETLLGAKREHEVEALDLLHCHGLFALV